MLCRAGAQVAVSRCAGGLPAGTRPFGSRLAGRAMHARLRACHRPCEHRLGMPRVQDEEEEQAGDSDRPDPKTHSAFYGPWQTRPWKPPAAANGRIPVNVRRCWAALGDVGLFKCVLRVPAGATTGAATVLWLQHWHLPNATHPPACAACRRAAMWRCPPLSSSCPRAWCGGAPVGCVCGGAGGRGCMAAPGDARHLTCITATPSHPTQPQFPTRMLSAGAPAAPLHQEHVQAAGGGVGGRAGGV